METYYHKSLIGILELVCENNKLISLKLVNKKGPSSDEIELIKNIKSQLDNYFSGKLKYFDIKINPKGTDFQKKVWMELLKIPYGKTISYSELAKNIKNDNASRAVGNACNKNPIMIIIPCHRVISKNGKIGKYAYGDSIKKRLLEIEQYRYLR